MDAMQIIKNRINSGLDISQEMRIEALEEINENQIILKMLKLKEKFPYMWKEIAANMGFTPFLNLLEPNIKQRKSLKNIKQWSNQLNNKHACKEQILPGVEEMEGN